MRAAILAVILASSCQGRSYDVPEAERRAAVFGERASAITFFREPRSGLCFAYIYETQGYGDTASGGPAMSNVPCEAVERLIANPAEAPAPPR